MSQELQVNLVDFREPTTVTFVASIDEMRIQRPGDPEVEIVQLGYQQAARFSGALAAMYVNSGPGAHAVDAVQRNSGLYPNSFRPSLAVISKLVPEDVAQIIPPSERFPAGRISFGNLAIASMQPSQEDRDQAAERRSEQLGERFEILNYDHAIVTLPSGEYYMPLDSPQAVLGLRVLRALGAYPDVRIRRQVGPGRMALDIWERMPRAERELFTDNPARLDSRGQFMTRAVEQILWEMAVPLGLVERITASITMLVQNRIDTRLVLGPPDAEFLEQNPRTISASEVEFSEAKRTPDLDRAAVEKLKASAAQVLAYVTQDMFRGDKRHRIGLDILDVLMPKEGKQALRELLGGDEISDEALQAVIDRLERAAERLLGTNSYLLAKRERTIAGWHATGRNRVQLRSGTLNPARTKWTIGLPDDTAFKQQPSSVTPRIRPSDE